MLMASNTPTLTQSEEARAPWNEERDALFEYEVTITETITRKFKVEASNSDEAKEQVSDDVRTAVVGVVTDAQQRDGGYHQHNGHKERIHQRPSRHLLQPNAHAISGQADEHTKI